MRVRLVPRIGDGPAIELEVVQLVVLNDAGTPIMVGSEYGPHGAVSVAHAGDADFNRTLAALGYGRHAVEVTRLDSSRPARGALPLSTVGG